MLSERCQQEFDVLDAIYDQELTHTSPNQLKVCKASFKDMFGLGSQPKYANETGYSLNSRSQSPSPLSPLSLSR